MKIFALVFLVASGALAQSFQDYQNFTRQWEGKRNFFYTDSTGHKTIGIGHKLNGEKIIFASNKTIEKFFAADMAKAFLCTRRSIKNFDTLPSSVKLVVVDMVFNCGENGFKKFHKAISAANTRDFAQMAEELKNSKWFFQTGQRARNHVELLAKIKE